MSYIICNENNYLLQTDAGFSIVNDINNATKWNDFSKANNVCKNMHANKKMKKYHLEVKCIYKEEQYPTQEPEIPTPVVRPIELDYDILDKIKEISIFTKQLEERKLYLIEQIKIVDLEIVDIEHAAEFYNLNASQGYKLYKLLHESRIRRREFKDELQKIGYILGTSMRSSEIQNLENSIAGLDNRQYTPRVLKELFGV